MLPFQSLEHIDEPREEIGERRRRLFDIRGRQLKGWTNKLIWGDNKLILSSLKSGALRQQIEEAGGLKLIYIDPPFDVGADFSMDIEIGGETFHKEPNLLEQIAYRDTWGRGADSFIAMIYERLILMRDLMHGRGQHLCALGLAVNRIASDGVMDEVFGSRQVVERNRLETGDSARATAATLRHRRTTRSCSITKANDTSGISSMQPYDEEYVESKYTDSTIADGRRYRLDNLTEPEAATAEPDVRMARARRHDGAGDTSANDGGA